MTESFILTIALYEYFGAKKMMITHKKYSLLQGFTLVELLISITIVSILAVAASVSYEGAQKSSRDNRRKVDLEQIRGVLELYHATAGTYPDPLPNCGAPFTLGSSTFMTSFPCDPKRSLADRNYKYQRLSQDTYILGSILEREEDTPQSCGTLCTVEHCYCLNNP